MKSRNNKNTQEDQHSATTTTKPPKNLEEEEEEDIIKVARVDFFPHPPQSRPSLLEVNKTQGFLNLGFILLIGWAACQMIDDYKKTGIFLDLTLFWELMRDFWFLIFIWLVSVAWSIFYTVGCEYFICYIKIKEFPMVFSWYLVGTILFWTIPTCVVLWRGTLMSPLLRGSFMMQICVLGMKSHSYYMTNKYLREKHNHWHHENISFLFLLKEYILFACTPTLIYEPHFPRQKHFNLLACIKYFTGFLICFVLMYMIVQKHLLYYLMRTSEITYFESIFYLGVPTLFEWMLGFYGIFHCLLNGLAELTLYADREFYLAWWDSRDMIEFWRLWNRSVYKWMARHIYVETMRKVKFVNKFLAAMGTFVVTAVMHELVLGVAFLFVRPMLFGMILVQIPFIYFTRLFHDTRIGNILMWGFPMLELWYIENFINPNALIENPHSLITALYSKLGRLLSNV